MKNKFLLILTIFICQIVFCQTVDYKTIPDVFASQYKTSLLNKINSGDIDLASLPSNNDKVWEVYSDRTNNKLKNSPSGGNNGSFLNFMEPLYVKDVKDKWLLVYGASDEKEKGWIEAKYLLLSKWSLKSDPETNKDKVSIPRKVIVLTSLDELFESSVKIDDVLATKFFYPQPFPTIGSQISQPKSFTIFFILKEQDGSVLVSTKDWLNESPTLNSKSVKGWMTIANVTPWDSRVALEPSRSNEAIVEYKDQVLPGYKDINLINTCVQKNTCPLTKAVVEFKVDKIRSNRMRKPILKSINKNIKEVVSISKNSSELDNDQQDRYKEILNRLDRKSANTNIVFAVDATSSMSRYFNAISKSVKKIIEENDKLLQHNLKFGLVFYRDYPDGKKAYEYTPLTTDFEKVIKRINSTTTYSSDSDLPEAQYNGLLNGLNNVGFDPSESNVVILIGDCGNHDVDKMGYSNKDVIDLFYKNNINLISYQVKFGDDNSYYKFNEDAIEYIYTTAKIISTGNELNVLFEEIGNNTYKLNMAQSKDDFEIMFGRFIYADHDSPMKPYYLEESIVQSLTDYIESVDKNRGILRDYLSGSGGPNIDGEEPPKGLVAYIMKEMDITNEEATDFLNNNEVTTKAFVALDYNTGVPSQVPVVFLTENEKNNLTRSFKKLLSDNNCNETSGKKKCFQENMIEICRSIIGPKTSTALIQELTIQQIWQLVIGIDFNNTKLKNVKLIDLSSIDKKDFESFIDDFELKAKIFCETSYYNSDSFKSRRFDLFGSYYYWIPVQDFPGTK
tara:strand:- start:17735 stop:20101 length:2367 start_codon:yes stop_codon:yes gene_type:complete